MARREARSKKIASAGASSRGRPALMRNVNPTQSIGRQRWGQSATSCLGDKHRN